MTIEADREGGDVTEIWTQNAKPAALFFGAATQWRHVLVPPSNERPGRLIRTGLDHAALTGAIKLAARKRGRRRALFEDCVMMEHAALEAFAEVLP